jgi:hypothetical protein
MNRAVTYQMWLLGAVLVVAVLSGCAGVVPPAEPARPYG